MTASLKSQIAEPGDIFSDDFENVTANKWLDMKAWGFGVWQARDGVLVSIDSSNITQQMYSALPKFDNAIVNRDYSVLFRYQPISGENYTFTIDVRPQGWNNYKFEISKDGTIRILKNLAGKLPKPLFISVPGQIFYDQWQWIRLEVTGEKPLHLKMKLWKNELSDEPDFFNAIAIDENPLLPQNMNFALTSIQSGGAYTMIDDFNIYRWRIKSGSEPKALVRPNNEKLVDSIFSESDKKELQEFLKEFASISQEVERLKLQQTSDSALNDLANLEVELFAVQKSLSDCDSPDNFHFYRESINKRMVQAKSSLLSLKEKQSPFHHQIGTFMRGYYSEIDGSLQGYALFAPDKYDGKAPFPLVINLHGYDPSFSSWHENPFLPVFMPHATAKARYILVNPFGRGNTMYQQIGEHDVLSVLSEVKRLYSIDENRIYLTGGSMGGAGTWWLGLSYPNQFAAIAPIMGPTEFAFWNNPSMENLSSVRKFILEQRSALSIAENASNLPIFCNHGVLDDIVPVEQSRKMVKRFSELGYEIKYMEHPEAAHGGFPPEMEYEIYDWFENLQRNPYPKKVVYKTGNLKHPGAYWVRINRFIDLLKFATIEAEITSPNLIEVKTDNVAEFSLTFSEELVNIKLPVKISVNGSPCFQGEIPDNQKITLVARSSKQWKIIDWSQSDQKKGSSFVKNSTLAGPIIDAYNSSFMLVYGTLGTGQETSVNKQEAETFVDQWRSWQHSSCRMKSDADVTSDDIANFNLILFGDADCNAITKKINASLPIRFDRNSIIAGEKRFSGDAVGLAMIYPNPLNPKRYIVIQAGISWQGTQNIVKRIGAEFDYIIFDNRTMGINVHQG
ncbi:MAG: prolyl oligopeptidase family serine peptidase, partial [bacterium]|nr:prolyl oligopeptidase family serine peptidase [bacterium]